MVTAGYGIRIGGVSGGFAVGTGSALGALVGRTTTLPTAAKAANSRFGTGDFTFSEGPGAANTGIQVDGESEVKVGRWNTTTGAPALVDGVPFGNIPINVDGFWVIARQGSDVATAPETDRIKILRDGAVARDARPLYFRRIPGAAGFTGDASIDVVVDQASVDEGGAYIGELRIGFEGNGEALPDHCFLEVYFSLSGGSVGPRGLRGLPGQDGEPGKNGTNGINGRNGEDGQPGRDGENGLSAAGWADTGSVLVAGTNITVSLNDDGNYVINSSGGGGSGGTTPAPTHQVYLFTTPTTTSAPSQTQVKSGVGSTDGDAVFNTATGPARTALRFWFWSAEELTAIRADDRLDPGENLFSQFTAGPRVTADSVSGHTYYLDLYPGSIGTASHAITWSWS